MHRNLSAAIGSQRQEVSSWLEELYGGETVPEFELHTRTIPHLHRLSQICRKNDTYVELVIDDLHQKTEEYNAEAQRLSDILLRLNFSPNNLSQPGVSNVKTLARLGVLLNVRDASDTCYFLALQELDNALEKVKEQRRQEEEKLEQITAKCQASTLQCKSLQKAYELVKQTSHQENQRLKQRKDDTSFIRKKIERYTGDIKKLQVQLVKAKFDDSIAHENLLRKSERLKSLRDQLTPLKEELQSYSSLPPDLAETKIRIEQQKRHLAALEKEVADSIDINLS